MMLPAPIAALFHALGQYHATKMGLVFDLILPEKAATPEPFWTTEDAILQNYTQFIGYNVNKYEFAEMPRRAHITTVGQAPTVDS